jgi:hypothetical protein
MVYLILSLLLFHEATGNVLIEECSGTDAPARALSKSDYNAIVGASSFRDPQNHKVILVALSNGVEPDEVLANFCLQRLFSSRLISRLNQLGAAVIAFDKQYSTSACDVRGAETTALAEAIRTSHAVITRGLPTVIVNEVTRDGKKSCLREERTLDLPIPLQHSGTLRLDADIRRAPLRWPVLDRDGKNINETETFAWVTATVADLPSLQTARIKKAWATGEQPYSTFMKIPTFSAIELLCGKGSGKDSDWRNCTSAEPWDEINGSIAVVGDHNGDTDRHNTPWGSIYGVDLQANYVAALLDQRYYLSLFSPGQNESAIVIFFLVLQLLFWKSGSTLQGLVYGVALWGTIFVSSIFILAFTGYLLTVWVQGINLLTILISFFEHWAARMD